MLDQPFVKLIDALAARTPTPGGGAAAAMAGCMGTALFLMVVRFSRGKKANVDREGELARAEPARRLRAAVAADGRTRLPVVRCGVGGLRDAEGHRWAEGGAVAGDPGSSGRRDGRARADARHGARSVHRDAGRARLCGQDDRLGSGGGRGAVAGCRRRRVPERADQRRVARGQGSGRSDHGTRDRGARRDPPAAGGVRQARRRDACMSARPPLLLCVLDGFGEAAPSPTNAVTAAEPRFLQDLRQRWPVALLQASGEDVGLPCGLMGNSEVGHLNIGAGRVVYQEITRIDKAIRDGVFFRNEALLSAVAEARRTGGTLHLLGLVSDGGVHSSDQHLRALLQLCKQEGLTGDRVVLHAFLDGRDTPPRSAQPYLATVERWMQELHTGRIGTVVGRYFAMDRDKRWDRVQKAYDALTLGHGLQAASAQQAVADAYARSEGDEFVAATVIGSIDQGRVRTGDAVLFFNFRTDRGRQLTEAFVGKDFAGFARATVPIVHFVTMTRYRDDFPCPVAFAPQNLKGIFPEIVARNGLRQLRIAETEKYAHVTFFFSGGDEKEYPHERRVLVPSPKVATYDLQPEMSAPEVTDKLLHELAGQERPDVTVLNFANADMVGHSGILPAAIAAVRTIDRCLARIVPAYLALGGTVAITADHGNVEMMVDPVTGEPHTAHTTNPVPLLLCGEAVRGRRLRAQGRLCDIATTLLPILGLPADPGMDGMDLLT
ncbi:MAG: 2,3-bisphosphoglycerate-independent phosphoglycerate mutase [Planctomycetes bacterium]|nr:2,3-bisphosphoglycerate-independent phosphoglycerate mutase [Planctomycetota bacterium]